MSPPLVSVIIDTYNYACFIEKAIESVLNQDFPKENMEVIVVDDGSTDDTKERLKKYLDKITYIYQENQGQASALNKGIYASKGEIICLLDADDFWYKDKIKKVVEEFKKDQKIGMVQHHLQFLNPDNLNLSLPKKTYLIRGEFKDLKKEILKPGKRSFTSTSGLSFKKKYLKNILPIPQDIFYCTDIYLTHHISFFTKIEAIEEYLGVFRIHGRNLAVGIPSIENSKRKIAIHYILKKYLEARFQEFNLDYKIREYYDESNNLYNLVFLKKLEGKRNEAIKLILNFLKSRPFFSSLNKIILLLNIIVPEKIYIRLRNFYRKYKLKF